MYFSSGKHYFRGRKHKNRKGKADTPGKTENHVFGTSGTGESFLWKKSFFQAYFSP